jgi:hypothetical protein
MSEIAAAARIVPTPEHFIGLIRLEEGLVLIQDLARFLSAEEGRDLDRAMSIEADGE